MERKDDLAALQRHLDSQVVTYGDQVETCMLQYSI